MGKYFAIGDIHGCFDQLQQLLGKIPFDPDEDTLIFMGDYIDRGPDSFEVVDYLIDLAEDLEQTVFLKGNHEQMLLNYLDGIDKFTYLVNGGQETLESYMENQHSGSSELIPVAHLQFFNRLKLYYEIDDFIFVHAGLKKGVPLEKQKASDLLWIRENFIYTKHDFGKRVIFGHTPFPEPLVQPNKIGIDTGAVYGRTLTCIQIPEMTYFKA